MRCLALADALAAQGASVEFVLSDDGPAAVIEARGYSSRVLHTDWRVLDEGADVLCNLCDSSLDPIVIVDSYSITASYVGKMGGHSKICYLGSKAADLGELSLIANYSTQLDEGFYERTYAPRGTRILLGVSYAPLRKAFHDVYRVRTGAIRRVLVTTGSTDPYGFLPLFLRAALAEKRLDDLVFSVVVGGMASEEVAADVASIAKTASRAEVLRSVSDMAGLMERCDAAVSANGTTVYELSAAGLPSITFAMVEEQVPSGESLARLGVAEYCGLIDGDAAAVARECVNRLTRLVVNPREAALLASRASGLIDGLGAARIAKEILEL